MSKRDLPVQAVKQGTGIHNLGGTTHRDENELGRMVLDRLRHGNRALDQGHKEGIVASSYGW